MKPKEFIDLLYPAAQRASDISPVFVVAQAALESGWGKSCIGKYNLFGITKGSWNGKTLLVQTTEIFSSNTKRFSPPEEIISITPTDNGKFRYVVKRLFRDYDTLEQALSDHLEILRQPCFSHAWPYRKSPEEFVKRLQSGKYKYATATNYVETMNAMFNTVRKYL